LLLHAAHRAVDRGRWVLASDRDRRVIEWVRGGYGRTLGLDYPLGPDSLVLDVGGYEGQWASDLFSRYCCRVEVFEPVSTFADAIQRRFEHNARISVHRVGLAATDRREQLFTRGPGSSLFRAPGAVLDSAGSVEQIQLVAADRFFQEHGYSVVDLMAVNIEGGEYELLEHLIDAGLVSRITDIQVQFHDFVPDARRRMHAIQQRLTRTHELTWQREFVFENWRRRS
jgi:FkbM family methyltransferase